MFPYANCGLPYYIGGVIRDRAKLTLQTPESFRRRFNVDVRVRSEVVEIARAEKKVRVREAEGGREYWESYDKLVYAPGAAAIRPAFVGEGDRIFTLRTMEDTFRPGRLSARGVARARPRRRRRVHRHRDGGEPRRARGARHPRADGGPGHASLRLRHGVHPARASCSARASTCALTAR